MILFAFYFLTEKTLTYPSYFVILEMEEVVNMPKTIDAIYENGVFKPLQKIKMKEHEKVQIRILSKDKWQKRFNLLIKKIHKKTTHYPAKEIETDITMAVKETRAQKYAR